ncbi:hypothetical protein [cf. Phormidesmis sp. LEGE 11477]|uniref:hypothetical protein n=1 Tax=cf. Phormidesmis sp. LEGE 11477 TaxID=1828680 RepID=UPI00188295D7|nr:hypothetical protein [cf. Phormidesmis sp. LEGE 11477]MBE9061089.1 hypothetical protein [cf. Phormidesmis sp. LEGE 11477]
MKPIHRSTLATLLLGTSAFFVPFSMSMASVFAQSDPPVCPPPGNQEYLLLVRGRNETERADIAAILPVESSVLICRYLDEVLVRAGSFTRLETVNAWSSYMSSEAGYESFVLRPSNQTVASGNSSPEATTPPEATAIPEATAAPETAESATTAAPTSFTFEPTRLETGYAVLVDYNSSPEIAATVSQLVSSVGLAVYQQRPYLLASYSESEDSASAILQKLSDAQLAAVMVNAQEVVRLSESVVVSTN